MCTGKNKMSDFGKGEMQIWIDGNGRDANKKVYMLTSVETEE